MNDITITKKVRFNGVYDCGRDVFETSEPLLSRVVYSLVEKE